VVNGIRDISSTGLYLLTEKYWPLGTMVMLTLQRTDEVDEYSENSKHSITVQLRVTRWETDGIGLVFVQPEAQQQSTLMAILGG
jgi:Tfp pilus assembly protein PilZ